MSVAAIVKALAKELSANEEHVQFAYEALGTGLKATYLARHCRRETGGLTEASLRRLDRRRRQYDELELRRAKATTKATSEGTEPDALPSCIDAWELEDFLLARRKPEPEVQAALDHGLDGLAELLVAPSSRKRSSADAKTEETAPAAAAEASVESAAPSAEASTPAAAHSAPTGAEPGAATVPEPEAAPATVALAVADPLPDTDAEPAPATDAEPASETDAAVAEEVPLASDIASPSEPQADAETSPSEVAAPAAAEAATGKDAGKAKAKNKRRGGEDKRYEEEARAHLVPTKIDFSPQLARVCGPFVNPDRGVHSDEQALEGAMRILADRLGRNPQLRSTLRRLIRKQGRLHVRSLVDEKKLGRSRSLLKLNVPLPQVQGHRLLSLRQAQVLRQITTSIVIDHALALPKVKAALGKRIDPDFHTVVDAVAERAWYRRILPMLEEDIRNELRERADDEATRFLGQHLRHVLLAPAYGPQKVAGVDVNARGDWTVVVVDANGKPSTPEIKLEASTLELPKLAEALANALRESEAGALAVGHGKGSKDCVTKLRQIVHMLEAEAGVFLVNESGLSSYANAEFARKELADYTVPGRMAVSLARRLQDPLTELLKTDIRHLGLGREQSVVSKANLRRLLNDTVEFCVAQVGVDLNKAPLHVLRHVPGIDFDIAKKIIARRGEKPFESLDELRSEGLLEGVRWSNAVGFLRLDGSSEPLDRTGIHPDHYGVVRQIATNAGKGVGELLGRQDALKGQKRGDHELDEGSWRDLGRELAYPGRDPRARLFRPTMLAPDTDAKTLEKEQVVEGVISNVTSFGAFVDLGIARDGMIHISEVSDRYVRDAREMLSIGQVVRARVLASGGPRVELSLKKVPFVRRTRAPQRPPRPRRDGERQERDRKATWEPEVPNQRAARTRRDGLAGAVDRKDRRGRKGGGGGGGGGRGGGAGGGRGMGAGGGRRGGQRDEGYDAAAVKKLTGAGRAFNPFATFFKDKKEGDE